MQTKVADYVMCIGTDKTIEFARPESIFTDERISRLYGLTQEHITAFMEVQS